MSIPTLTIIRGLPGAGKSTLARRLCAVTLNSEHFEADMYFEDEKFNYVFDPSKLPEAHAWCLSSTKEALRDGKSVFVSNTFSTMKELEPYAQFAKDFNCHFQVIECFGQWKSIHNVPEHTIQNMKNRWEYLNHE